MSKNHSGVISIVTEPKVGLGQRAILCCTRQGNLLWDCITYIDDDTVRRINELGGIDAIAISHPHYYSTAVEWAHTFNCPVYYSAEDEEWIMRFDIRSRVHMVPNDVLDSVHKGACQVLWTGPEMNLLHGELKVVKTSGHFPGSSVLYWRDARKLLVADSVFVVPSGRYTVDRLPGTVSFTFMWSYPNMVRCTIHMHAHPVCLRTMPSLSCYLYPAQPADGSHRSLCLRTTCTRSGRLSKGSNSMTPTGASWGMMRMETAGKDC